MKREKKALRQSAYMKANFAGVDQNAETPDDLFASMTEEFGVFGMDVYACMFY